MVKKDLIVIGGGPAGYAGAVRAAQLGAKVMLLESAELGGICLHRGCIPTKVFLQVTEVLETARKSKRFGVTTGEATLDFNKMINYKDQVIRTIVSGLHGLMKNNAIEVVKGVGRLKSKNELKVTANNGISSFSTDRIILATGSSRALPPIPGVDGAGVITTDGIFKLQNKPESMAIIGAGPCGVELANIFAVLGTKVYLVEMLPHIVPTEDREVADALERCLKKSGIKTYTGTALEKIEDGENGNKKLTLIHNAGATNAEVQMVVISTGSRPNTQDLGLEDAGVKVERGAILADAKMQTSVPGIWAAGDVAGGIMLAHVASREAEVAAENALGMESKVDYSAVPACIYTMPEIGSAGLSESAAIEKGYDIKIGRSYFAANSKALIQGERNGFVKIVAESGSGEILGIHIFGAHATELVSEAAVCIAKSITIRDLSDIIHAHPTLHEAIREAAVSIDYGNH
ncbi:MAG: dihydrolipoyl dehydrogenase [Deltaproteobacteria bacterium]|nr:dihydrolipoyl dehydrogenase [Deltaproteobacteria bacterium]